MTIKNNKNILYCSFCGKSQHEVRKLIADDFSVVKQATIEGLGVTALPNYMCQDQLAAGELIKVLPDWQLAPSNMYALYAKNRTNLPKIKALLDYLDAVFKQKLAC